MAEVHATIDAGICGFVTEVTATTDDEQNVRFEISSPCENIQRLATNLGDVDAYSEIGAGFDGVILQAARACLKGCCSGCVVPNGIFKAMQVAAQIALPKPSSITLG